MKYSLMIGRYQPLHDGHITLIRKILDEGKNVCIALRDTDIDENNPYTFQERMAMFHKVFVEEVQSMRLVVAVLPDIEEVVYGRRVGWGIREINLDKETEAISATEIRKQLDVETRSHRVKE